MHSIPSSSRLRHRLSFEAIGTRWHIDTPTHIPAGAAADIYAAIQAFDQKWSRFRSDSQVSALRLTVGALALDADEYAMWQLYRQVYDATDSAVSPLVAAALEASGYDAAYSLTRTAEATAAPDWDDALSLGHNSLTVHQPTLLDIGAAGKGLLVDRVAALLSSTIDTYTIDAGGDIYVAGHSERIALEHPDDASFAIGVAHVTDSALCGSAPNRRAWADTHHIIDARSGVSTTHIAATWALAATAMAADLATTTLFFLPPESTQQLIPCQPVVMNTNGQLRYTTNKDMEIYA